MTKTSRRSMRCSIPPNRSPSLSSRRQRTSPQRPARPPLSPTGTHADYRTRYSPVAERRRSPASAIRRSFATGGSRGHRAHRRPRLDKRRDRASERAVAPRCAPANRSAASLICWRRARSFATHAIVATASAGVRHTDRGAGLDGVVGRLLEVERVRPDDHRRPHGARFDQILPTEISRLPPMNATSAAA